MQRRWTKLRTTSFVVTFLLALAGCANDGTSSGPSAEGDGPATFADLADKEKLDAIQEELTFRPPCSECTRICQPLRGYFKSLCTRACQKSCVTPCEQCKNTCRSLSGAQREACLNSCATSPACGGTCSCGNGRIECSEQCDDGNRRGGDGCSATCVIEPPLCGNGVLQTPEQCDDGNTVAGDGCSPTCTIEPPPPQCGNGVPQTGEECDDGNVTANDGCSPTCTIERCGDGTLQTNESCDDGNTAGCDGCGPSCRQESCGDGVVCSTEQCDDANTDNSDACHNNCTSNVVACGDGDLDANELCDDGNTSSNDGCSAICQIERCGDGVVQSNETCDDANTSSCDGCSSTCHSESCGDGVKCAAEGCDDGNSVSGDGCSPSCSLERCGDGVVQPNESCDDGNTLPGDGCEINCTISQPGCDACRNANCRNYIGIDLVSGCFTAVNPEYGANPADPSFVQECINVMSCARTRGCALDEIKQASGCYCGSATIDECTTQGPAADSPCLAQIQAATRTTSNTQVLERFTDLSYPMGWAYFLLDCDRQACNSAAVGDCTKPGATRSSKSAYVVPVAPGVTTQAILTSGDSPNLKSDGTPYRLVGLPDGMGAFDNNDGTMTLLVNHELGNTAGIARAHGGRGAFVSRWIVNKADLSVSKGEDLIQSIQVWNPATSQYEGSVNLSAGRFCSADLPALSAFYDSASGLGYNGRLFMNGEETGNEGRAFAHGLGGVSWELPWLGKASWENIVASPLPQTKTIVVGLDDSTPGQVYVYVGNKTNTGSIVDQAGLSNGTLYGVAVTGFAGEPAAGIPSAPFSLASLGNVQNSTGAALDTASTAAGVTLFNRPEDGAWDPSRPSDFYFVTTNAITAPSRLWRLRFADITQPELGGTLEMLLDGTEGQIMMDNLGIDGRGHVMITEDPGNNARIAQVWRYDIATDALVSVAQHNVSLFTSGGSGFLTQDEEASGAIDATALLGPGWWLLTDQVHAAVSGELVEQGQLTALFDPGSL